MAMLALRMCLLLLLHVGVVVAVDRAMPFQTNKAVYIRVTARSVPTQVLQHTSYMCYFYWTVALNPTYFLPASTIEIVQTYRKGVFLRATMH